MTATTDQKIVLITGANKGIGFAAARELARAGHTVLLGARDPGRGAAAAAALTGQGLDARFVRLDVTDPATIAAAAELIEAEHGRLDILINNAGISRDRPHPPDELPVAALREIYETNVFGVVAVTNAMLPLLRKSPAARIGNVSSGLGTVALLERPGLAAVAAREPARLQLLQGRAERDHPHLRRHPARHRDQGQRPVPRVLRHRPEQPHRPPERGRGRSPRRPPGHPARRRPDRRVPQRGRRHLPVVSLIPGR